MSRDVLGAEQTGVVLSPTDESLWTKAAGFDIGRVNRAGALSPKQKAELSHVRESMSGYSDDDLESMARIGRKAQLALDLRRSRSSITPDQVDEACQQITKR